MTAVREADASIESMGFRHGAVLAALPVAWIACDADGRVVAHNNATEQLLGVPIAPHCLFDRIVHPTEINGESAWRARVERPGGFIEIAVVTGPLPEGGAIHCLTEVDRGAERGAALQRSQEAALLRRERWFRGLLEALPVAVYTTDADGRITFYNSAAAEFWGHEPQLFSLWCGSWKLFAADGTPIRHDQCPMAIAIKERRPVRDIEAQAERPNGTRVPFMPYPTPLFDEDGSLLGAVNMLIDISAQKATARHQQLMINELNHRVKNTLATVQSIAAQTLKDRISPEARQHFQSRILALSRAHDVLTRGQWMKGNLRHLLELAIAPLAEGWTGRFKLSGPDIEVSPKMALALAMAFHELLTNAAKYGSLSGPEGSVAATWHTLRNAEEERLILEWRETGGPRVGEPNARGFGTRLIEQGLAHELRAAIALEFRQEGLVCTIDAPLLPEGTKNER